MLRYVELCWVESQVSWDLLRCRHHSEGGAELAFQLRFTNWPSCPFQFIPPRISNLKDGQFSRKTINRHMFSPLLSMISPWSRQRKSTSCPCRLRFTGYVSKYLSTLARSVRMTGKKNGGSGPDDLPKFLQNHQKNLSLWCNLEEIPKWSFFYFFKYHYEAVK